MAAYDNLLFIGASRQCFHQPPLCLRPHEANSQQTMLQAAKHSCTHTHTQALNAQVTH